MRGNQRLRNGQAKPESSKAAGNLGWSLFECVKDFIDCFFFDANAGVDDAGFNCICGGVNSLDSDSPFFRCKLHTVLDQVPKDLLQARRIALHVRISSAEMKFYFEILCRNFLPAYFVSTLQGLVYANRLKT